MKLRGYRIELGEIEAALAACPGVRQAAVVVRDDDVERRLYAFVAAAEGACDAASLRTALAATLPAYMVPAHFVILSALPLTPNGKVDR